VESYLPFAVVKPDENAPRVGPVKRSDQWLKEFRKREDFS